MGERDEYATPGGRVSQAVSPHRVVSIRRVTPLRRLLARAGKQMATPVSWMKRRLSFRGPPTQLRPLAPQVAGPRNLPSAAWRVDAAARAESAAMTVPDDAGRVECRESPAMRIATSSRQQIPRSRASFEGRQDVGWALPRNDWGIEQRGKRRRLPH